MTQDEFRKRIQALAADAQRHSEARRTERREPATSSNSFEARLRHMSRMVVAAQLEPFLDSDAIDLVLDCDASAGSSLLAQASRWLATGAKPFLVLFGPAGTGKTTAAAAVAMRPFLASAERCARVRGREIAHEDPEFVLGRLRPRPGLMVTASSLGPMVEKWRDDTYDGPMLNLRREGVVVLDDLGSEMPNSRTDAALFDLVNARQNPARCRTVITSNLSLDELAARYDSRTLSRLAKHAVMLPARGPDMRRRRGAA